MLTVPASLQHFFCTWETEKLQTKILGFFYTER